MTHPPRRDVPDDPDPGDDRELPRGWDDQRRRQNLIGLSLTPAQRLRWLVETMETMRRWQGRARDGRPTEP